MVEIKNPPDGSYPSRTAATAALVEAGYRYLAERDGLELWVCGPRELILRATAAENWRIEPRHLIRSSPIAALRRNRARVGLP